MFPEESRRTNQDVVDSLETHLGSACSREDLHQYIAHAYESRDLDLSEAVHGFYESDILITNKYRDRISGQNSRSDEINVGLNKLLERESSAYCDMIDAEGGFYDLDFPKMVWRVYSSEHSEQVDEIEDEIMGLIHGEYENKDHFGAEHPLRDFSQFQKNVLEDMYGEDAEIPLVKGIGFDKLASFSPDIDESRYESSEQRREAVLNQISAEGGINIARAPRDSWSTHPSSAENFASRHSDSASGLMLKNSVNPEEVALSSITVPHLTSERESLLEDDTRWFSEDEIITVDEADDAESRIEAYLWQIENLNL